MALRRKDVEPIKKQGWYYRYWNSMNLEQGATQTFTVQEWNDFIQGDPKFNKKLKEKSKSDTVKNDNILNDDDSDMCLAGFLGN